MLELPPPRRSFRITDSAYQSTPTREHHDVFRHHRTLANLFSGRSRQQQDPKSTAQFVAASRDTYSTARALILETYSYSQASTSLFLFSLSYVFVGRGVCHRAFLRVFDSEERGGGGRRCGFEIHLGQRPAFCVLSWC